jgi:hypothetical protein
VHGFLLRHRHLLWRHRDVAFPLALFLLRRRARLRVGRLVGLLAVPLLAAGVILWWLRRRRGPDGDDGPWHPPDPAPVPPPPEREPAEPVAA